MSPPDKDSISSLSLSHTLSTQASHLPNGDVATPPLLDDQVFASVEDAEAEAELFPGAAMDVDGLNVDGRTQWDPLDTLDKLPATGLEDTATQKQDLGNTEYLPQEAHSEAKKPNKPFRRWMKTLHKRALRRQEACGLEDGMAPCIVDLDSASSINGSAHHGRSSSGSSFGFVAAVRSASVSLTSASVLSRTRKNILLSARGHSRTDRSSRASVSGTRRSEDSFCLDRQVSADPAVIGRALQRRRILEELINTEESYIGDVRFLMNACGRPCMVFKAR